MLRSPTRSPGGPRRAGRCPTPLLSDQARRDAESALTSALLRGAGDNKVDFAATDRLLRLARRHGISLQPSAPVEQFVQNFAFDWLRSKNPQDSSHWALRDHIIAAAQAELRAWYAEDPAKEAVRGAIRKFVPHFNRTLNHQDPLHWPMQAAGITLLPAHEQVPHVQGLLKWIDDLRKVDRTAASRALRDMQKALVDWDAVTEPIAATILTSVSGESQVIPEIADLARNGLARKARTPDRNLLEDLDKLNDRVPASSPELVDIAEGNKKVKQFLAAVESGRISQQRSRGLALKAICEADPIVVGLKAPEVIDALRTDTDLAIDFFLHFPRNKKTSPFPKLIEMIGKRFAALATSEQQVEYALWAFQIYADPEVYKMSRAALLQKELQRFPDAVVLDRAKNPDKWRTEVRDRLRHNDLQEMWDSLFHKYNLPRIRRG